VIAALLIFVLDPQGRHIAGASVAVTCGFAKVQSITDERGSVAMPLQRPSGRCTLIVERTGFDSWREKIVPGSDPIFVHLTLKSVAEHLTVRPTRDNAEPIGSSSSSGRWMGEALTPLGNDPARWIAFALNASGSFVGTPDIRVDGLPSDGRIDPSAVAALSVNADAFSAERTGVARRQIDVETVAPSRTWLFGGSPPSSRTGGRSFLGHTPPARISTWSANIAGPMPRMPLTFSLRAGSFSTDEEPAFVVPDLSEARFASGTATSARISSWASGITYARGVFHAQASLNSSRTRIANAGVGGLNAPSSAGRFDTSTTTLRGAWSSTAGSIRHRGGVVISRDSVSMSANTSDPGLIVTGQLISGSVDAASERDRTASWTAKHVVEIGSAERRWRVGVETSRSRIREARAANPFGHVQMATVNAPSGAWVVDSAMDDVAITTSTAGIFIDDAVRTIGSVAMRAGVRVDWQHNYGVTLSPRLSLETQLHGFAMRAAAGVFADGVPADFLAATAIRSGQYTQTLVVPDTPMPLDPTVIQSGVPLRLKISNDFSARRDFVVRMSVSRTIRFLSFGIERTETISGSLSGLSRRLEIAEIIDSLASDRHLHRSQTHVSAGVTAGSVSVTDHFEFISSRDNTDGAFSLPERQKEIANEWGRSSGIASRYGSIAIALRLPGKIDALISGSMDSGYPYTVITGRDPEKLATFVDRQGRPRNELTGPGHRQLSVYASRSNRFWRLKFDAGVSVENLFNHANIFDVGRVSGTPWLGRPLQTGTGRSIEIWTSWKAGR
jgi:hypothetical protein